MKKEDRTPETFRALKYAIKAITKDANYDPTEFFIECMTFMKDHPEDDILTIVAIVHDHYLQLPN